MRQGQLITGMSYVHGTEMHGDGGVAVKRKPDPSRHHHSRLESSKPFVCAAGYRQPGARLSGAPKCGGGVASRESADAAPSARSGRAPGANLSALASDLLLRRRYQTFQTLMQDLSLSSCALDLPGDRERICNPSVGTSLDREHHVRTNSYPAICPLSRSPTN